MPNQKLRYEVDVNARDGIRELDKLGKAGKEAGEDIEKGLEDAESAGKQAAKALVQAARDIETELKADKEAADAFGRALGSEMSGKIDTGAAVAELKSIGLTADDVKADADTLALALKEIDDIKMSAVKSELTTVDQGIRNVGDTSDQSRSVLANMAGNAAQDLGELGGVTGTLGVGLGQLAEYATEGNIKLSQLAKVAGPMAAVAAATLLITSRMSRLAEIKAWETAQVEGYAEAVEKVGVGVGAIEEHLRTMEDWSFDTGGDWHDFLTSEGKLDNIAAALGQMGFTVDDVAAAIAGGTAETDDFTRRLEEAGLPAQGLTIYLDWLTEQQEAYATATANTAAEQRFFAESANDMLAALRLQQDPLSTMTALWDTLIRDVADGTFNFENAEDAINQLATATGLSREEIVALVAEKADEKVTDLADAFIASGEAAAEQAIQIAEAAQAVREYGRVTSSADWGEADFVGATTAYEEFRQAVTGDRQQVAQSEEAWDGLGEAIDGAGSNLLNMTSPEGRQVFDALDELGTSIVPDLAQAFADSDGDIDTFRRSADTLATQTMRRLQDEFGVSQEDARLMIAELGLLPEQVTTFYELAGDEAARVKLGLLQGVIDGLPEDVQTEVAMHILADDPVAALDAVERAVSGGVTTPMHANTAPAMEDYRNFKRAVEQASIVARIVASGFFGGGGGVRSVSTSPSSLSPTRGVGAESASVAYTTSGGTPGPLLVPFTAPPVNNYHVEVKAAVIGDSHAVRRAIGKAMHQNARLGSRP